MEENNIIIAKFMGKDLPYINNKGNWEYFVKDAGLINSPNIKDINKFLNFNYNSDWNWLMEVVEKITSILMLDDNYKYNYLYIGYDFEDKEHYVNLYVSEDTQLNGSSKNSKIEATYEAVVKFINFYNKQKEE